MLRIETNIQEWNARLRVKAKEVNLALVATINRLSERFIAHVLGGDSPASAGHKKKGFLSNSVRPIPAVVEGNSVTGGVVAGGGAAWYGRLFEDGHPGYTISAANKKFLKFELGGEILYRKTVQHTGFSQEKLQFMKPVADQMRPEARADILATVTEVLNAQ